MLTRQTYINAKSRIINHLLEHGPLGRAGPLAQCPPPLKTGTMKNSSQKCYHCYADVLHSVLNIILRLIHINSSIYTSSSFHCQTEFHCKKHKS